MDHGMRVYWNVPGPDHRSPRPLSDCPNGHLRRQNLKRFRSSLGSAIPSVPERRLAAGAADGYLQRMQCRLVPVCLAVVSVDSGSGREKDVWVCPPPKVRFGSKTSARSAPQSNPAALRSRVDPARRFESRDLRCTVGAPEASATKVSRIGSLIRCLFLRLRSGSCCRRARNTPSRSWISGVRPRRPRGRSAATGSEPSAANRRMAS